MNVLWGIVMMAIGASLVYWGTAESEFVVYRLLVARSKLLWSERVHRFHQIVGGVLVVLGLLWAFGVIWQT
ncbi:MAG: hypothetical protein KDB53_05825 [Planctomycetes bacterium]|nr:hypothetical protein [Planctomycetota bacterium]